MVYEEGRVMAIRLRRALTCLVSELYQQAWNEDHFVTPGLSVFSQRSIMHTLL